MKNRLINLKNLLIRQSLDAALISSPSDIIYLTNFSYFSESEREAFLLITRNNNYIFTDGRYTHAVKKYINDFTLLKISSRESFHKLITKVLAKTKIKTLGLDLNEITALEYQKLSRPGLQIKNFNLSSLRTIKDNDEISFIQKACDIGDKAFSYILTKIKPGFTEKQIALKLELFIRKKGADLSFPTIVAFEENAAIPHHQTGNRKLKHNELILLDFGVKYQNYCSDMTRAIHFGKASSQKQKAYQTVYIAQQKAIVKYQSQQKSKCENEKMNKSKSLPAKLLDFAARTQITSKGYETIPHSLGHGIGLEVHESPSLSPKSIDKLENGMVFSIEPGIYLPEKFGIRLEDLFTIQNNKLIQLTNSPKNFTEI
jgi:Xaa-Pro aminopeptidase